MCGRRVLLPTARNRQCRGKREQPAVGDKIREEREESCEKLVTYNEELTSNQRGAYCDQRSARGKHPDARGVPWWGVAKNAQRTERNEKRAARATTKQEPNNEMRVPNREHQTKHRERWAASSQKQKADIVERIRYENVERRDSLQKKS